jgi:alpha-N-arabinofuranosidase
VVSYENPILRGFYPDPSICRVGEDYYLATSSFEYFPGVPIFTSRDLVHFRQVGHALTRPSQLLLSGVPSSQGIYAPTIRHHDGTFYLVTTIMPGGKSFIVTTQDPAGEWSEPIPIVELDRSMDPSLFFDDDGKVYYTRHGGGERGGIYQAEIDVRTGKLDAEARLIWKGTGDIWPEGPHLYELGGLYYLLISEGGTGYGHALTVARSRSPFGPFEPYQKNPILTHRGLGGHPIQATGHGDLVSAESGAWFMALLGIRPPDGAHHQIGRETFLAPVELSPDGWPIVNGGAPLELRMHVDGLPAPRPLPGPPSRTDFDSELGPEWIHVRNPEADGYSLRERPGFVRLRGSSATIDDVASPTFVGRRQQHYTCHAAARLEFAPAGPGQEAGLVVRQNEQNHYDLLVVASEQKRCARLRARVKGAYSVVGEMELSDGPVTLSIDAAPSSYSFLVEGADGRRQALGELSAVPLSSEAAGGFTGAVLGLYATAGEAGHAPPADFDWFEYREA